MKRKLKDIRKGDTIILYIHHNSGKATEVPYQVQYITFQDEKVWDMSLTDQLGNKKHYSFLNWNDMVTIASEFKPGKCPTCGSDIHETTHHI